MEPIIFENNATSNNNNQQYIIDTEKLKLFLDKKSNDINCNINNIPTTKLEYIKIEKKFKKKSHIKSYSEFNKLISSLIDFPSALVYLLYKKITEIQTSINCTDINHLSFLTFWCTYIENQDLESILFKLLQKKSSLTFINNNDNNKIFSRINNNSNQHWLDFECFIPLVEAMIDIHPGLKTLHSIPKKYKSIYCDVVIVRLLHSLSYKTIGRISLTDLKQSNLIATLRLLDGMTSLQHDTSPFSFSHFKVLFRLFELLDTDCDGYLQSIDLIHFSNGLSTNRCLQRVIECPVFPQPKQPNNNNNRCKGITFKNFLWFLLSDIEKQRISSIHFWFRCLDMDGDGYISFYELEYFFEEIRQILPKDDLPFFNDTLCQIIDMFNVREEKRITLNDLKKSKLTNRFLYMMFSKAYWIGTNQARWSWNEFIHSLEDQLNMDGAGYSKLTDAEIFHSIEPLSINSFDTLSTSTSISSSSSTSSKNNNSKKSKTTSLLIKDKIFKSTINPISSKLSFSSKKPSKQQQKKLSSYLYHPLFFLVGIFIIGCFHSFSLGLLLLLFNMIYALLRFIYYNLQ